VPHRVGEAERAGVGQNAEQPERRRMRLDFLFPFRRQRHFRRDLAGRRRIRNHQVPAGVDVVAGMMIDVEHRGRVEFGQGFSVDQRPGSDPLPVRAVEQENEVVICQLFLAERLLVGADQLRVARRRGSGQIRIGMLAAAVAQELLHPERGTERITVGPLVCQDENPIVFEQQLRRFRDGEYLIAHRLRLPPPPPWSAAAARAPGLPSRCGCRAGNRAPACA